MQENISHVISISTVGEDLGRFLFLRRPEQGLKTFGCQRDSFCRLPKIGKFTSCRIPLEIIFITKQ